MCHGWFEGFFHCKLISFPVHSKHGNTAGTCCDNDRRLGRIAMRLRFNPKSLLTSDIIFAVRSCKLLCLMYIKPSSCAEYQIYYHKDKMLEDCMFSQSYRSLIESQNCCLDNSNPNSVIGSTVNQFETPVRVDISTRRFSLLFFSVVKLSMTFLYFSSIDFFISVLSFFRLSAILSYCKLFKLML